MPRTGSERRKLVREHTRWLCNRIAAYRSRGDKQEAEHWQKALAIFGRQEKKVVGLQDDLKECRKKRDELQEEVERLNGWLGAIDGGDNPIQDEERLRQMAYEARSLGKPVPEEWT